MTTGTTENVIFSIGDRTLENVVEYVYLSNKIKFGEENQIAEKERGFRMTWAATEKLGYILRGL